MRRDLQSVVGRVPTSFQYEDQDEHKCALHALNNLFYARVFTLEDLTALWTLLPFLEATGELYGCLAEGLREHSIMNQQFAGEESASAGFTVSTIQTLLCVCGFECEQRRADMDGSRTKSALEPGPGSWCEALSCFHGTT